MNKRQAEQHIDKYFKQTFLTKGHIALQLLSICALELMPMCAQLHQGDRPGHREEGGVLVQLPCHPGSQVLPLFQTQLSLCPVLASNVSSHHLSQSSELFNISRYGLVMSIVATRDLVAGEEIFVSYNYALEKAPEWYQVL